MGRLLVKCFFHFVFADGLFVRQIFGTQGDVFQFHALRNQIIFFVRLIICLQCGIIDFYLRNKGFRIECYRTDIAGRLSQLNQLLCLRIADNRTVLHQIDQTLQRIPFADVGDKLAFRHMALAQEV